MAEEWGTANVLRPGAVPAGWRHRRTAVRVGIHRGYEFLDVDDLATHQVLTRELAPGLASLGYAELDTGVVRGPDRRVTRLLAQWAYEQENEDGYGTFAGIGIARG
ncbi:MAG TPA: hypothetical protein VNQ77_07505 [Frankiaceae bacterium]|nr:hypothetical protein [Frankiaceae bacterium]